MFSYTGGGGGGGYVGTTRWHTGKEVTTATWWWLKVYMSRDICDFQQCGILTSVDSDG